MVSRSSRTQRLFSIYDKISTVHFTASDRLNPVIIHIIIKIIFIALQDFIFYFLRVGCNYGVSALFPRSSPVRFKLNYNKRS